MRVIVAKTPITAERIIEQKAVRHILNEIRNREGMKWPVFWKEYVGVDVGIDFEKNFNTGEVGLETFAKIKDWIITHEAELARDLYPEYFPRGLRTDWQGFIEDQGEYGFLNTTPFTPMTLHEISSQHPINPVRFKIGQEFTMQLECPIFGSLIALDCFKNDWYPIPLHEDQSFTPVAIKNRHYGFPIRDGDTNQIVLLRQRSYAGEHGHCFIIGPSQIMNHYAKRFVVGKALPLSFLNKMAKRLAEIDDHKLSIHLENVIFE